MIKELRSSLVSAKTSAIEINNLTTVSVEGEFLKRVAKKVLEGESASWRKKNSSLSIALVGQGRIRALNKKYLRKNRTTDVLAFPGDDFGEIVICLREVKKNAGRGGVTLEKELTRVLIHGILHLLGYDHEKSEKAAKKMTEKENYYLNLIFE